MLWIFAKFKTSAMKCLAKYFEIKAFMTEGKVATDPVGNNCFNNFLACILNVVFHATLNLVESSCKSNGNYAQDMVIVLTKSQVGQ